MYLCPPKESAFICIPAITQILRQFSSAETARPLHATSLPPRGSAIRSVNTGPAAALGEALWVLNEPERIFEARRLTDDPIVGRMASHDAVEPVST